jgi:processive 1,2-diacylglycerol beta-glucosyltransferase
MSVGGGHGRAGACVAAAVRERAADWEVRSVDLRDRVAGWFRALYVTGYLFIVRRVPWLWGFLYRHPMRRSGTLPPWLLDRALRPFERLVREFQPDVILATQITASEAADRLRRRGLFAGVAATVVTDFDAHPSWRAEGIDRFFVPDESLRERFLALGIAPGRVEATGVPIDPAFEREVDVAALRARFGLRPGVPAVLLMGGSLGLGAMEAAVRTLLATGRALDLLVVAGHNDRLRRRLEAIHPAGEGRLQVFGFVDFVPDLMAVADLFVSKPGGLSMTEALTRGLPTLAVAPLPGQEEANARHLAALGVVRTLPRGQTLAGAVLELLTDAAARCRLSLAARGYAPRTPAHRIAERLIEMAQQKRGEPS